MSLAMNIRGEERSRIKTLMDLSALINSSLDIREIRKRTIEAAVRLVNAETGSLLFIDAETGDLYFDVALGEMGESVRTIRLKQGQGIAGWVATNQQGVVINDVQNDPRFYKEADFKSDYETCTMICLPVKLKDKTIGVIEAINKRQGLFNNKDKELLTALSNQVAVAIENARLYKELRETFVSTVYALADTIEKRDPYTGGHTKRVMEYSLAVGQAMKLSPNEMLDLRLSAILHDIGKIGVRDDILLKKDQLTLEEFSAMAMHTTYGVQILNHVRQLKEILPGVKWHHEKFDGSGYPDGLKGDAIPLIARIIAVADTFDAITTDRPYRKGLNPRSAIEELKANAGKQFDPLVVDAFVETWQGSSQDGRGGAK